MKRVKKHDKLLENLSNIREDCSETSSAKDDTEIGENEEENKVLDFEESDENSYSESEDLIISHKTKKKRFCIYSDSET